MIRLAALEDAAAINQIYNLAVEEKYCTAHTYPVSLDFHLHRLEYDMVQKYPVWVACTVEGKVAGWISVSPYRSGRQALQTTAEISYYVHPEYRRTGIGSALLANVIQNAGSLGFSTLIAILLSPNLASIRLLKNYAFELWGCMPGIANIDGKRYDHLYFGLHLPIT